MPLVVSCFRHAFLVLLNHLLLLGEHIRRTPCHHSEDALWPMLASCIMLSSSCLLYPEHRESHRESQRKERMKLKREIFISTRCHVTYNRPCQVLCRTLLIVLRSQPEQTIKPHPFHISGSPTAVFLVSPHLIDGFWEEFPPQQ